MDVPAIKIKGSFGVRNDKGRGLLVETLEVSEEEYFFKYHDQPLSKHCVQLQGIVKAANVQRARKLHVDLTPFLHEYVRVNDSTIVFRGTQLKSVKNQIEKVYTARINKEIGQAKRQETMEATKQEKILARNKKIKERYESAEAEFQAERARQFERFFGGRNNGDGSAGGSGNAGGVPKAGGSRNVAGDDDIDLN